MSDPRQREPQAPTSPQGSRFNEKPPSEDRQDSGGFSARSRFNRPPATNSSSGNQAGPTASQGRFSPFGRRHQHEWMILPTHVTLVRFALEGLGDPFHRLLGHALNTDFGDCAVVINALEQGGDTASALQNRLDAAWRTYDLHGAALVYRWHPNVWSRIAGASPIPERNRNTPGDHDADEEADPAPSETRASCLRAIDLALVLNVLARARTQILLASAPIVFSQHYLSRLIISDDPRLVGLVRATGYIEEKL